MHKKPHSGERKEVKGLRESPEKALGENRSLALRELNVNNNVKQSKVNLSSKKDRFMKEENKENSFQFTLAPAEQKYALNPFNGPFREIQNASELSPEKN